MGEYLSRATYCGNLKLSLFIVIYSVYQILSTGKKQISDRDERSSLSVQALGLQVGKNPERILGSAP